MHSRPPALPLKKGAPVVEGIGEVIMWFLGWLLFVVLCFAMLYCFIRFVKWAWHRGEGKKKEGD